MTKKKFKYSGYHGYRGKHIEYEGKNPNKKIRKDAVKRHIIPEKNES